MTPIEELLQLRQVFKQNFDDIERLRQNNITIWERIKQLSAIIKQEPLEFTDELSIDNGGKCFICGHVSKIVCQICLLSKSPCGYCDRHRANHNKEFGTQHEGVFRPVKEPEKTFRTYNKHLSPEQTLAQLEAKIAELKGENKI